jgi:hypothetical protein
MTYLDPCPKAVLTVTEEMAISELSLRPLGLRTTISLSSCFLVNQISMSLILMGSIRNSRFSPVIVMYGRVESTILDCAIVI